jgi:hypothetical protein
VYYPAKPIKQEAVQACASQFRLEFMSPKPVVAGSSPAAPASFIKDLPIASSEPNDCNAVYLIMKPTPIVSEKRAAIVIWIGAAVFTVAAMIFGC